MLVKNPHDLTSVHCRTTADSDNCVRLESSQLSNTLKCTSKCWVWSNIEECFVENTHFIEFICDSLCITILIKELVCYDECLFLAHNSLQLVNSNRETTLLEVYLFRCSEPKHILSPLNDCLNVQQVLNANVLRN